MICSLSPQLFHRYSNQSLMLTFRAYKVPPRIQITKKGANIAVQAAVDVYVVCNSSEAETPQAVVTVDSVCSDNMPLALTLGIVSPELASIALVLEATVTN